MKKVFVTILALVYFASITGATVNLHYCMDKLVAWSIGDEKANKNSCPYCGMAKTNRDKHCGKDTRGCCKDEQKQVKTDKDQKAVTANLQLLKILSSVQAEEFTGSNDMYVHSSAIDFPVANAPPGGNKVPVFLLHCNFRI